MKVYRLFGFRFIRCVFDADACGWYILPFLGFGKERSNEWELFAGWLCFLFKVEKIKSYDHERAKRVMAEEEE